MNAKDAATGRQGPSRRELLAAGAAGAGAGLVAVLAGGSDWQFVPPEYPGKGKIPLYDMIVPTTCAECGDGCGLICFIKGARLIAVQGNPDHPGNRGSICLRSFAGINQIYDPERALQPMRRAGPRGSGRFEPVSWEEALDLVAEKIADGGRAPGLFFEDGSFEGRAGFRRRFLDAAGVRMRVLRRDQEEANALAARRAAFGLAQGFPDVEGARYILNFGADPLESGRFFLVLAKRLVETVIRHRAKLVTFEPRLSNTAARSHEWFPIAPGAEGLVALAVAGELVRSGRYDRGFVERHTDTTHDDLLAHLKDYTPEAVERSDCGVSAETVRRVTDEFVTEGPSIALAGAACTDHVKGYQNQRCVDLLNILAGAVDRIGGLDLYPDPEAWFAPVDPVPAPVGDARSLPLWEALEEKDAVKAYFSYMANPVFSNPDTERTRRMLADEARLPFLAVCDTHWTETAMLADVFLPAATPFETWGVQPGFQTLSIRRPAAGFLGEMPALRETAARGRKFSEIRRLCRPIGDSRALFDILTALGRRLGEGVSRFLDFENTQAYLEKACQGGEVFGEGGFAKLCEDNVVSLPPPGNLRRQGFPTPSGRIELGAGGALPSSDWKSRPLDLSAFTLLPYTPSTSSPVSSNAKWLFEVIHDNPVWVHRRVAEVLQLKDGQRVRLVSEAGSVEAVVRVTEGIFPKALAMARGFGHTACGRVAQAVPFESADRDTAQIWWGRGGPGVNPCTLVAARTDPEGGGVAWIDTEVRLERME